jgi:DNA-binding response OmpR family regulator
LILQRECEERARYKELSMAKIFVVDDEKYIRDLYALELSNEGYQVETTASCARLIEELEISKPNLIVLDIRLVEYDGLQILLEIREHFPDLPIIICSAYDSYRYDARTTAADAYVVKSFDFGELKMKIQRALEGKSPEHLKLLPALAEVGNARAVPSVNPTMDRGMECTGLS